MGAGPPEGSVVARHGHGDEADGYGAGLGCLRGSGGLAWFVVCGLEGKGGKLERERERVRFFAMVFGSGGGGGGGGGGGVVREELR